ncbi:MAG: pyridoxal-phosphate dependent enzyme [Deltaproteobacteria bacterium]|nr:pyridoxal-phosphate dependent enzyme [Deltaproteobacteria bacterium]MBW2139256.1 pyridoxal-phosphate dependent enzyme [Deltaproteobacteria bacterium]
MTRYLHIETPIIESVPLSRRVRSKVWLKMEALQPSGSFKLRGIGHACQHYFSEGAKRFISSSGGNAGIAVAYSGRKLGLPVTVVVPETTSKRAIEAIEQEDAEVIIKGATWQEAHHYSLDLTDSGSVYIHPFDNPLLWTGHATIIDEIRRFNLHPDAVVLSVGGGGLLCGIIEGLHRNNMSNVPVLAVETEGADSLSASLKAGRHVELDGIKSIATSLGAKKVAKAAYDWCHKHEVVSHVVSDIEAVDSCLQFSNDHRILVEPACGASLAALYNPTDFVKDKSSILVIVCGGAAVSISQLESWKRELSNKANSTDAKGRSADQQG